MPKSRTSSRIKSKKTLPNLSVKLPSKQVRERFLIIYELEGCQKAVNFLTKYCRVRRMKIILNGKRVKKEWVAWYYEKQACCKKEGLTKRIVLHELYHHLVETGRYEISLTIEEREAERFSREFVKINKVTTKVKAINM